MKSLPITLLSGLCIGALVCVGWTTAAWSQSARSAAPFVWEAALAEGATVEIKNVSGSIRARPAAGTHARVQAERTGRRDDPAQVEIEVVEHAGGVTFCAIYPSARQPARQRNVCRPGPDGRVSAQNNDVQVAFTIELPPGVSLVARTTTGAITAEGLTARIEGVTTNGDVHIEGGREVWARTTNGSITLSSNGVASASTTNGQITARLGGVSGASPMRFRTTNGSVTLALPDATDADLTLATTTGSIDLGLPVTVDGGSGARRLTGRIGAGGTPIEVRTTNGSIRIVAAPES
jgi:hypothetical protein